MKKIFLYTTLLFIFASCSTFQNHSDNTPPLQSVRFLNTTVNGNSGRVVELNDGSRWTLAHLPFVVPGQRATVVLFKKLPGGLFFTTKGKYRLMPNPNEAFDKGYDSFFYDGYLGKIEEINRKKGIIVVSKENRFKVLPEYLSALQFFKKNDDILLNENKTSITNLTRQIMVPCKIIKNRANVKRGRRIKSGRL